MMAKVSHQTHLFVPAVRPDLALKAAKSDANALIVDLEDSVSSGMKLAARDNLSELFSAVRTSGKSLYIRVNNETHLLEDDINAALAVEADGIVLPKAESVEQLYAIDRWVTEGERRCGRQVGSFELELQVETAGGVLKANDLASALERITSIMLGVEDFTTELGMVSQSQDADLIWAHAAVLLAAVSAGIAPYGLIGEFSNFRDLEAYRDAAVRSWDFGYIGAYCIHPAQVELVLETMKPTPQQLAWAERVIAAHELAASRGQSVTSIDGNMIDKPVVDRARAIVRKSGESLKRNQLPPH